MSDPPETGLFRRVRGGRVAGVLGVYAASAFGVLQVVDLLADNLGLPAWVFPSALALLVVGLPIILTTALVQTASARVPAGPPRKWLTWRRALLGGVAAFTALGLSAGGYLALRAAGIGPFGSLVAKGEFEASDRILIADFHSAAGDSVLAGVLTEAFRIDLAQSSLVRTPDRAALQEALARMERDPASAIDFDLARELAQREGIPVVLAGEIGNAGPAFLLAVRLVATDDGRDLAAFRETARDSTELIPAIDRLSKKMRERMGESLRTIRQSEALAQVTTGSLPALRKYTQAVHALEVQSDRDRGIALLEEALRFDTAFAMAWRKLGVELGNAFEAQDRRLDAVTRAWNHRDRLTPRERYMTEGTYFSAMGDTRAAMRAYESLLEEWPTDYQALNNLAMAYGELRDYVKEEELLRRAIDADSNAALQYRNLVETQVLLGEFAEAEVTLRTGISRLSQAPFVESIADLATARGDYDRADSLNRAGLEERKADPRYQAGRLRMLAMTAALRGRLAEAEALWAEIDGLNRGLDQIGRVLGSAINFALLDVRLMGDTAGAVRRIEAALARDPMDRLPVLERPYLDVAYGYAVAGRTRLAQQHLAEYERLVDQRLQDDAYVHAVRSAIALADGRPRDAVRESRLSDTGTCEACAAIDLGRAFVAAGEPDSAIAEYERYFAIHDMYRIFTDFLEMGPALQRLAEMHEAKGDAGAAATRYAELLELWRDADPVLQPRVAEVRRRLARLTAERG
jgi:tetratricopeptide (TPR) repeat protein